MRFSLGRLVATPAAMDVLEVARVTAQSLLIRHMDCDWGDMCDSDKLLNDQALEDGGRLFSSYTLPTGKKVWVITEADRSSTTILLPEDY